MPQDVRVWEVLDGGELKEFLKKKLDLEGRMEEWLEKDISMVSSDLLVIGRQVKTDFGGWIDLLCLDQNGDIVIVELKRDKTPREITAQILDYASWVKNLSNEKINNIANSYLGDRSPLEDAFRNRFGSDLPDVLNEHHEMLVVASEIDPSTERIIKYLSDSYGVGINAVSFHYYHNKDGKEFLARAFLIEPSQVEYSTQIKTTSKRQPNLSFEELQAKADGKGVGEIYKLLAEGLEQLFDQTETTRTTMTFIGLIEGRRMTIISLVPDESSSSQGLRANIYVERLSEYLNITREDIIGILPQGSENQELWKGAPEAFVSFFNESNRVKDFLAKLSKLKK